MVNGVYTLFIPSILLNLAMLEPVKIFVSVGFNSKQQQKSPKNHVESVVKIRLSCVNEIDCFSIAMNIQFARLHL